MAICDSEQKAKHTSAMRNIEDDHKKGESERARERKRREEKFTKP
jgi:hypothetical protein